jgi:diguanylate cyclase (GGDEF)-like protein/PAS domain S-box-containing protein
MRTRIGVSEGADNTARKQAEETLLKAGALQSAIFNSANFSSIATDAKGVIQIFNVGAERMLGYAAAEVMNKITPADISDSQEVIARAKALSVELGTPITPGFEALVFKASRGIEDIYELTYIRKDGTRFPAVVSVTALRDAQDIIIGYLLIGTDNTARKLAEEALLKAGALQSAIFNSANFSSIATDAKGVIQIFNVGAERMLGYTAAEVMNKITPADISDPQELIARAKALSVELATPITQGFEALVFKASRGIEDIYELTYIRKDGSRFPAVVSVTALRDAQDVIIGYLLIGTDNTARKQAEEALLKAGALQRAIFNSANFSSIATDAKGVIQIFNVGAERMLGYAAADVINKITPADISDSQEVIARAKELSIELGTAITPGFEALVFKASRGIEDIYELTYIRKDGSRFPAVVSVTALRDAQDVIIGYLLIGTDNTARKQVEGDLRRTKIFLDTVIENVPMPILVKTAKESRFMLLNKAGEELFGFKRDQVIEKTPHDIYDNEYADFIVAGDRECLLSDQPIVSRDQTINSPKQGVRLVTAKKVAIQGGDGKPEYLLTVVDDVTDRRQAERRIAHMAHCDSLTDLPNRAALNECLTKTLSLAEAERKSFAILCMDLDGFKEVNDVYGHAVGDAMLRQTADRLSAAADGIFVARPGGDEFTIIADNNDQSSIAKLADRLLAAFADDFELDGHRLRQALSIGVAVYPVDGTDGETLMKNADAALYRAKAEAPGSIQFFGAKMATRLRERTALQTDLRLAIERNELLLHYQPQLKMTGEIIGFEALARWHSPKRGMVPPGEFIPLAEESSLILLIGEWVLREACREAASWAKPLRISVNVSPIQFSRGDLPRLVHSVLLESGLAPGRLELEITEGVLIDDFSRAVSILRRLKALGVQIVLDDFGTGYSSLSYLHAFPFDKIKIDRTFISDLESNGNSIAIVRAVINLGRNLKMSILAEGVESKSQHAFLLQEGCDEVQGYLTGRPLPIAEYAKLVGRQAIAQKNYAAAG